MTRLLPLGLIVGALPILIYVGMTVAFRAGFVDFGTVFGALRAWLSPAIMIGAGVSAITAIGSVLGRKFGVGFLALLAALASVTCLYALSEFRKTAHAVPPIHDISTDTIDPPSFTVTAAERSASENPPAYDTEQTEQQLEAYPDLSPIVVEAPLEDVFKAVESAFERAGVKVKAADLDAGLIEGTATTMWFGFKDDVVARIRPGEGDVLVIDIRSKSRVGRSDVGANAARIRKIRDNILEQIPLAG